MQRANFKTMRSRNECIVTIHHKQVRSGAETHGSGTLRRRGGQQRPRAWPLRGASRATGRRVAERLRRVPFCLTVSECKSVIRRQQTAIVWWRTVLPGTARKRLLPNFC